MQRHGYKGAFELAATVDYLFGYDATAGVVDDWMYGQLAESYVFDETNRAVHGEVQPVGAARDHRAAAGGGRPRDVGQARRRRAGPAAPDLPRSRRRSGGRANERHAGRGRGRAGRPGPRHGARRPTCWPRPTSCSCPSPTPARPGAPSRPRSSTPRRGGSSGWCSRCTTREHDRAPGARLGRGRGAGGALVRRAPGRHGGVRDDRRPVHLLHVQLPRRLRPRRAGRRAGGAARPGDHRHAGPRRAQRDTAGGGPGAAGAVPDDGGRRPLPRGTGTRRRRGGLQVRPDAARDPRRAARDRPAGRRRVRRRAGPARRGHPPRRASWIRTNAARTCRR